MDEEMIIVFFKVDNRNRIVGVGSNVYLHNTSGWIQAVTCPANAPPDVLDRYKLAESHYLPGGTFTDDGIPRFSWDGQHEVARTEEEIESDRANFTLPAPSDIVLVKQELAETKAALLATQDAMATLYETIVLGGGAS